ncbi:putative Protein Jade-1 [Nannochloris sp. 'desiccata']|nr:putative Protein Jade-1 [Chlorella desiccata (nom. nud.)]
MAKGQATEPSELALNPSQLSLLKRQIASLRSLNGRLKALANGVKPMPVVNLGSKRGRNVIPQQNNRHGGGRRGKNKAVISGSDTDEQEASDTDEEDEVDDDSDSEDEAELSDSSLSAGKLVGKRGSAQTAPTRRTPRSIGQRPIGKLKETSFDEDSDEDDSDAESNRNAITSRANNREKKGGPSSKKKRKLFVVVGGEPDSSGAQLGVKLATLKPIKGAWTTGDDDALCSICGDGDGTDDNLILLCEGSGCDVAAHQTCYGVDRIPQGEWLCDTCAVKKKKKGAKFQCSICPVQGGALRRVTTFGKVVPVEEGKKGKGKKEKATVPAAAAAAEDTWMHVACALWTPGVSLDDPVKMSKINVSGLTKERVELKCTLCSQAGGAVVQCSYGSCCKGFHVLCGRFAGYQLTFSLDGEPLAFCNVHSRPQYSRVRQAMAEGKDAEEAMEIAAAVGEASEEEGTKGTPERELNEYEKQRQENLERIAKARKALLGGN